VPRRQEYYKIVNPLRLRETLASWRERKKLLNISLLIWWTNKYFLTLFHNFITMAKFITTIELFNADEKDYQTLGSELKNKSFKESNSSGTKKEYNREGNITLQEVTDAVLRAAAKTGKKYSFTIIRNKPVYS
jgi:hypothetical protein